MGLLPVILGMIVVGMTTVPLTKWYLSLQDSTIKTEERMQAQSYAFNEWQQVLAEDYGNVTSKSRKAVSDKYDLVREVGAEKTISTNGKEKDVTITVYKTGTNEIAYTLASAKAKPTLDEYFTKAQVNSLLDGLRNEMKKIMPVGTIVPYYGSLSKIPDGWHLCDGTAGTPNLKDRFLVGAGASYGLGATGGEAKHTLSIDEMPSHNHWSGVADSRGYLGYFRTHSNMFSPDSGYRNDMRAYSSILGLAGASGCFDVVEMGLNVEGWSDNASSEAVLGLNANKLMKSLGGNGAHENRPPYFAVYYIMKIK